MIWANTDDRYGAVHKTLHWVIVLLVVMMLIMGIVMEDIPNGADKFWVYGIHKSIGITILFLMLTRLAWKIINWHRPKPLPTHKPWERALAATVHWGLYVLLIAMPLSGWLLTGAANSTINWFGFFTVPNIIAPNPDMRETFGEVHELISLGIWGLIGLHVAGALKHTIIDRDETLRRMVPFGAALLMMIPAVALSDDKIPAWNIDRERSTLLIQATQEGGPFTAQFKAFDGKISLDPKNPETGTADIVIDLASFNSGNGERDQSVQDKEWFNANEEPTASYIVDSFEAGEADGTYIAHGRLFLRGIERELDLPFTLETANEGRLRTAHAFGQTTLQRLEFDVGSGPWKDVRMVGNDVIVQVDLYATAKIE